MKYYVTTYDPQTYTFTPQKGVRIGPHLPEFPQRLPQSEQGVGYSCYRNDPSVSVSGYDAEDEKR